MVKLEELFVQNKGYLTSKLIRGNRSLYYQLKTMLDDEKVVQIKRGLYRHKDFAEEASWGDVCRIAPQAVICLFSAWRFYELSTQTPTEIHVAIIDIELKNENGLELMALIKKQSPRGN